MFATLQAKLLGFAVTLAFLASLFLLGYWKGYSHEKSVMKKDHAALVAEYTAAAEKSALEAQRALAAAQASQAAQEAAREAEAQKQHDVLASELKATSDRLARLKAQTEYAREHDKNAAAWLDTVPPDSLRKPPR